MPATLFADSAEDTAVATKTGTLNYSRRLAAVLGNGADWTYDGDCNERQYADGVCACGHHGIRFEFLIKHPPTGRSVIVGSSCIETYGGINPEMVAGIAADVVRLESAAADRKRQAKTLAEEAVIQAALAEYSAVAWALDARLAEAVSTYTYKDWQGTIHTGYKSTRRVTREVFFGWHTADVAAGRIADRTEGKPYPARWKQYKSRSAFLRTIRKEITAVTNLAAGRLFE